jgi:hypothetical protein
VQGVRIILSWRFIEEFLSGKKEAFSWCWASTFRAEDARYTKTELTGIGVNGANFPEIQSCSSGIGGLLVPTIMFEMGILGDKNNQFFHATTTAKRKMNAIKAI